MSLRNMRKRIKEIDFRKSLMVMDAFKAHYTDDVAAAMLTGQTGVVKVLSGCTSKKQLLDVCIKKLFKSILRECLEDHVFEVVKDAGDEANNNPSLKPCSLTRKDIVNWVH